MPDLNDGIGVEQLVVGPLACNCTIVADPESGGAIVVDGGAMLMGPMARPQAIRTMTREAEERLS